jgi:hypothetical protein
LEKSMALKRIYLGSRYNDLFRLSNIIKTIPTAVDVRMFKSMALKRNNYNDLYRLLNIINTIPTVVDVRM